jgi:hypothetical protein
VAIRAAAHASLSVERQPVFLESPVLVLRWFLPAAAERDCLAGVGSIE